MYALNTISALKADLDFTYEKTEQARRRLVVGLHGIPQLVQGLDAYFGVIRRGFDLIAGAVVVLEDELLNDLRVILERWLRLIDTMNKG
ncbi:uncharacterized protein PG998_000204 [Apiospora kogelbergensis]|uniref:uncharacterized protein n=1 Tax=Apiospora kogelbergensis TaxID=1337665 RepID=UPI00313047BF